jgi:hypothetical protein
MTLQLLHSEFPYTVYEENLIFFFISVLYIPLIILFKITATDKCLLSLKGQCHEMD